MTNVDLKTIYFESETYTDEKESPQPVMNPGLYRVIDGEIYLITNKEPEV